MAMMKAMPLKVECSNKISPLLHLYFYNINFFNASFKSQFYFTHNLDELYVIVLDVQQYTLSMSTLVGNLFPRILNFFHHSVNKKMPWVHYCLGEANVCLRSRRKINSHKMFPLQVTLQRQYSSLHLQNCYFFLNYHNIKYILSHKLHRRFKTSVKHPKWTHFWKYSQLTAYTCQLFFQKSLSKIFDSVLNTPLNYMPINTIL